MGSKSDPKPIPEILENRDSEGFEIKPPHQIFKILGAPPGHFTLEGGGILNRNDTKEI